MSIMLEEETYNYYIIEDLQPPLPPVPSKTPPLPPPPVPNPVPTIDGADVVTLVAALPTLSSKVQLNRRLNCK